MQSNWVRILALFLLTGQFLFAQNFEENIDDFVLETKRIKIPSHPYAFNPSIIRWQGKLLMSYRVIPSRKQSFTSYIGLVWLDDNFDPVSPPQLLSLRYPESKIPCRAEEGRLIQVDNRLYIVYSDCEDAQIHKGGFRVYVAELVQTSDKFSVLNAVCLSTFEGQTQQRREKNWVPFNHDNTLLLAYSLNPHLIFQPDLTQGSTATISSSTTDPAWEWGELRGGTPGLVVDGEYLAFFHSSIKVASDHSLGEEILHYFMGAYVFSSEPPFSMRKISPKPIVAKGFYEEPFYKPYWKPVRVVFPCGFVFDDNYIWVAYGREDHETWVVKLDKKGLLKSLVPVN